MNIKNRKVFLLKTAVLLFFCAGLFVAGISVFLQAKNIKLSAPVSMETSINNGSSFEVPDQPIRIVISKINVDAKIEGVGITKKGEMGIPSKISDVAWYNLGTFPGMPGSAVIAGHLNGIGAKSGVFRDISKLKKGDLVEVIDKSGKKIRFKVISLKLYDYDAATTEVFSSDDLKARLNLITCAGDWVKDIKLYNKRLVVFTELVTAK